MSPSTTAAKNRALWLSSFDKPLELVDLPIPDATSGSVVVQVLMLLILRHEAIAHWWGGGYPLWGGVEMPPRTARSQCMDYDARGQGIIKPAVGYQASQFTTMAHVVPGVPSSGGTRFPKHYAMSKWNEDHLRLEADAYELEVIGEIPSTIHGAFYRVQPDHAFPPIFAETEIPLNGDGNVSSFYIKDGHVDFKQRYVRTPKLIAEREARQALFGRYRNKYTDDPRVQSVLKGTTANTHVVFHDNKLMALKEDARPMELDPITLETLGYIDYHGTLRCPTHTAHPKADSTTGELVSYGYEAAGDAPPDICSFTVDKDGKLSDEVWFQAPWPCMIHDFWATDNWVVFPINGLKASLEQMKKGGDHFYWDENLDYQLLGVIPRRGAKPEDAKWFKTPQGCYSHTINAYEEDGKLVLDANVWTDVHFPFFPNTKGERFFTDPRKVKAPIIRYRFDPNGSTVKGPSHRTLATTRKIEDS
ncbi:Carotenoid oxygenase, partial [Fusarium albosuccineum]